LKLTLPLSSLISAVRRFPIDLIKRRHFPPSLKTRLEAQAQSFVLFFLLTYEAIFGSNRGFIVRIEPRMLLDRVFE